MKHVAISLPRSDPFDWAERSDFWQGITSALPQKRKRRERTSKPLILCGHGVSLRVENGTLVIRDGFTHYPQTQAKFRYFRGDLETPSRILLLDGSGTLSFDVLSWLAEQGVALARIKWSGEVATVASGTGFACDREKVRWQQYTRADEISRLRFSTDLISRKLTNSVGTLQSQFAISSRVKNAVAKMNASLERIQTGEIVNVTALRAIEGECAAAYFAAWQDLRIDWIGTDKRPVSDAWKGFSSRSSLANGIKPKNYNASHPVNAALNYAYTVRLAQLQIQAIADGYDPTIGVMHHAQRDKPAYIFDLIEPERPKVDALVLRFLRSRKFAAADFVVRADGGCRLSPQLARTVASLVA